MLVDERCRFRAAIAAAKKRFLASEVSEDGVRPAAGALDVHRAAGVATQARVLTLRERVQLCFQFPRAGLCLEKVGLYLLVLRLKLAVLGFVFRQLRLDEPKVLAQYRRTAMLGYQSLQRTEQRIQRDHFGGLHAGS